VGTDVHSAGLTLLWSFVCIKAVDLLNIWNDFNNDFNNH